jgi:hypothetical protein
MVSGFIYCFKSKQNRDRVQEYIMKGFEQMPFHTEEELEEKYGNIEEELGELGNIEIN